MHPGQSRELAGNSDTHRKKKNRAWADFLHRQRVPRRGVTYHLNIQVGGIEQTRPKTHIILIVLFFFGPLQQNPESTHARTRISSPKIAGTPSSLQKPSPVKACEAPSFPPPTRAQTSIINSEKKLRLLASAETPPRGGAARETSAHTPGVYSPRRVCI